VHAAGPTSRPACAGDVCVVNILRDAPIAEPCEGYSVLVAYNKSSGVTLIQCSEPGTEMENISFAFNSRNKGMKPVEFFGGRFIRPEALADVVSSGSRGEIGSLPLCAATGRRAPASGELLIAEKQPSASGQPPYCYRINYVGMDNAGMTIVADNGKKVPPSPDDTGLRWDQLRKILTVYLDKAVSPDSTQR
jgi:hypothetical protein